MFSLFYTLLAAPVMVAKCGAEAGKEEAFRKMDAEVCAKTDASMNAWIRSVTEPELENEIMSAIRNGGGDLDKYWDEIVATTKEVWGDYVATHGATSIADLDAARILMANRGKLLARDAKNGISPVDYGHRNAERRRMEAHNTAILARWMNKKLRQHGIDEQLLTDAPGVRHYYIIDDRVIHCGVDECEGYSFVWKPMVDARHWVNIIRYTGKDHHK